MPMRLRTELVSVPKGNMLGISGSASWLGRRSEGLERLHVSSLPSQNNTKLVPCRTLLSSYGLHGSERLRWGELAIERSIGAKGRRQAAQPAGAG